MEIFNNFKTWLGDKATSVKDTVQTTLFQNSTASEFANEWKNWLKDKTKNLMGADIAIEGIAFITENVLAQSAKLAKMVGLALTLTAANNCSLEKYTDAVTVMFGIPEALIYLTEDFVTGADGCKYILEAYDVAQSSIVACAPTDETIYKDTAAIVKNVEVMLKQFCTDESYRSSFNISEKCREDGIKCVEKNSRSLVKGGMAGIMAVAGSRTYLGAGGWGGGGVGGGGNAGVGGGVGGGAGGGASVSIGGGIGGGIGPSGIWGKLHGGASGSVWGDVWGQGHAQAQGGVHGHGNAGGGLYGQGGWRRRTGEGESGQGFTPIAMKAICHATDAFNGCLKKQESCKDTIATNKLDMLDDALKNFCAEHRSWKGSRMQEAVGADVAQAGAGVAEIAPAGAGGADVAPAGAGVVGVEEEAAAGGDEVAPAAGGGGGDGGAPAAAGGGGSGGGESGGDGGKSVDETSAASLQMLKTALCYLPLAVFRFI